MIKVIPAAATALLLAGVSAPAMAQSWMPNWDASPSWTGGYIGVLGGATQANDQDDEFLRFDRNLDGKFGDPVITSTNANAFSPGSCGGAANGGVVTAGCDDDAMGAEGVFRAGYDFQFGSFVVGGLVEYSGVVGGEDSVTSFSTTPASYTFERKIRDQAAVRARAGFAYGPALVYGTAGAVTAEVSNQFYSSNSTNAFKARGEAGDAQGYQAGGGVEYMLAPHLSVTGEYLYTSLEARDFIVRVTQGTAASNNPFVLAPFTTGTDMTRSNGRIGLHAVRIGMAYRF